MDIKIGEDITEPGINTQEFPHPCYRIDDFRFVVEHMLSLALLLTWIFTLALLVRDVLYEKETRLREVMKLMSLSGRSLWHSWIISASLFASVIAGLLTLMTVLGNLVTQSDWFILLLVNELYALNTVFFGLFITLFFNKANIASAVSAILYIMTYIPYFYVAVVETTGPQQSDWLKIACSFFAPSAVGFIFKAISSFELIGGGLHWHNITETGMDSENFNVAVAMLMMVLSLGVYSLFIWYLDNVCPGQYGIARKWNFCISYSYWSGGDNIPDSVNIEVIPRGSVHQELKYSTSRSGCYETPSKALKRTVCIRNLTKVYSNGKIAVNNLSLNLYEGQILSFLGHNGAGKTTTMSILTGMMPMTAGQASIYGYDVSSQMIDIRQMLGMCPQHNVLFETLSVMDHLEFYSSLKSLTTEEKKATCLSILNDTGLASKAHSAVATLSGGMKRKLSIAIAFIGNARMIVLDEPTAGVDPCSRREIWDFLVKYKQGRTIMLTTHHMDEAEALGDRIAVISGGCLLCDGSPLFLKSNLGEGYHLVISKTKLQESASAATSDLATCKLTLLIQGCSPGAYLKSESPTEWNYILPHDDLSRGGFSALFHTLDRNPKLRDSYGVSDTTLEEIFLMLTQEAGEGSSSFLSIAGTSRLPHMLSQKDHITRETRVMVPCSRRRNNEVREEGIPRPIGIQQANNQTKTVSKPKHCYLCLNMQLTASPTSARLGSQHKRTSCSLYLLQFYSCFVKRLQLSIRNWKGLASQIVLPVIFIAVAMVVAMVGSPTMTQEPPLKLSTTQYLNISKLAGDHFVPIAVMANKTGLNKYLDTFKLPSGIGGICTLADPHSTTYIYSQSCYDEMGSLLHAEIHQHKDDTQEHLYANDTRYYPACQCNSMGVLECDYDSYDEAPAFRVVTQDVVQNFTGNTDVDFLYNTSQIYQLSRYGAVSFGHHRNWLPWLHGSEFKALHVENIAKAHFHTHGYHAMPTFINALNNAILRANIPDGMGNPAAYGIVAVNHPMNGTTSLDYILGNVELKIAILVTIGLAFIPALTGLQVASEHSAKKLQIISGLHPSVYWLTTLLSDLLMYQIPAWSCVAIFMLFDLPAYTDKASVPSVIALFVMYGIGSIPLTYLMTRAFSEPSYAYIFIAVFNVFTGAICLFITFLLEYFDNPSMTAAAEYVDIIFLIFPTYSFGKSLTDVAIMHLMNTFYEVIGEYERVEHPMNFQTVGRSLLAMGLVGIVSFILTLLCEFNFLLRPSVKSMDMMQLTEDEDDDVKCERQRVQRIIAEQGSNSQDALVMHNLTKVYGSSCRRDGQIAVKGICLAIPHGECFGMLGVNGAGKTTTFNMLTGQFPPSGGNAWISGHSIIGGMHKVYGNIGHCPQFDALFEDLTAREHLFLYARIKGIPNNECPALVQSAVEKLRLVAYADKAVKTYSGGNRRKLSTAIALLGDPAVIFMDEPTAGMDPHAKRFLWDLVLNLIKEGKSIVLTSHSMDECEKLCSRMAIMVQGQLKCLGSAQLLKSKYGDGYTIIVNTCKKSRVLQSAIDEIKSFMQLNMGSVSLKAKQHGRLEFEMKGSVDLGQAFRVMEEARNTLPIQDYSICQNTLNNVFVNFVRGHSEGQLAAMDTTTELIEMHGMRNETALQLPSSHDENTRL
ncbi:hypothetical protein CAPTEDRAFT_153439 [Capitella teleta]|uniref:ABC transporter domain-containing protein n=1 Tax=Capitella teleta TaxID=283909 RepID=R7U8L6_CAPTE|nr:hypothetical protein CAPTEDRAFT_153439 [Capitella teleta]|eukprot:ELU00042.1 hypothetical protein CAPTEDRAFT_153439 [Capitella teleta]